MLATWPHIVRQFAHALTPSGGLSYHYLAFKYQKSLWQPHSARLQNCLKAWAPFGQDLILFGPSGGYSLSSEFLSRFRNVFIYDPDPLAEIVFKRRFPQFSFSWFSQPFIFDADAQPERDLRTLRHRHPEAAILFTNSLGQWPLLNPALNEKKITSFVLALDSEFAQNGWASYHDIFSGVPGLPLSAPNHLLQIQSRKDVEIIWSSLKGTRVVDHLMFDAFQNALRQHWFWTLTPKQLQMIEWATGPLQKPSHLTS